MNKQCLKLAIIGIILTMAPNAQAKAKAKAKDFEAGMAALLVPYLKIHALFIEDKGDGVPEAAARMEALAREVPAPAAGVNKAKVLARLPAKLLKAAARLKAAKDLHAQRAAFKQVSRPMVLWATLSRPEGIKIVYCEMEKASWLQRHKGIRNPYHGSKMLFCGQWVKPAGQGKKAQ